MIDIAKPHIGEEEKKAVLNVLNSGMLVQGLKVKEFEEKFAKFCGTKYAIAMNSGTAALHSALYALEIGSGDEVITTPFTFVATVNSILMQGAKPIFVDIKEDTFNIDPEKIKEKITNKTKAIIPVDLYGQLCDYDSIEKIAREYNLKILEDSCQAVNAEFNGKKAGNFGDIAAFSFYATKNMITGEGGMIVTNIEKYAEFAKKFRHHGQSEKTKYEYLDLGYNYRMMDLQAAIGIEQLKKIDQLTEKRIKNAKILIEGLKNISGVKIPEIKEGFKHVFHQFTIKVNPDQRDEIVSILKNKGINCEIYYPKPLHLHQHFQKLGYKKGDFPISEQICKEVISLPVHPNLSIEEINYIIKTLSEIL